MLFNNLRSFSEEFTNKTTLFPLKSSEMATAQASIILSKDRLTLSISELDILWPETFMTSSDLPPIYKYPSLSKNPISDNLKKPSSVKYLDFLSEIISLNIPFHFLQTSNSLGSKPSFSSFDLLPRHAS